MRFTPACEYGMIGTEGVVGRIFLHWGEKNMIFKKEWLEKKWVAYSIATCLAVILYVALIQFQGFADGFWRFMGYFAPVLIGVVIAYVMDPLVVVIENYLLANIHSIKRRRFLAVVIALFIVILFIVVLLVALIPQVVDSVVTFVSNIDNYVNAIQEALDELQDFTMKYDFDISNVVMAGTDLLEDLSAELPQSINRVINTSYHIGKGVFMGVIACIMAIYFLLDKIKLANGISRFFKALLSERKFQMSMAFWRKCNSILVRYIVCDLLDGLIIGFANFMFMVIAGMPYATLISVVVGVTNLAPTFGPILGAVIGSFILVLINPWHALWFLVFTIILQTVDGYILKPKLFGDQLGVSSVWILICIIVGGRMLGVFGILVAIPIAAILDYLYGEWLVRREKEKQSPGTDGTGAESMDGTGAGSGITAERVRIFPQQEKKPKQKHRQRREQKLQNQKLKEQELQNQESENPQTDNTERKDPEAEKPEPEIPETKDPDRKN